MEYNLGVRGMTLTLKPTVGSMVGVEADLLDFVE